jgi:UDP-N-acetylmuramoyl-tripeptide--D-alanyl-D-alanine ligase
VLEEFPARNKVLVTPGMIELGDIEAEENRKFGEEAAAVCSHVILVGPQRTKPIAEGLASAGFPAGQLTTVRNLDEATARLREILGPGDVVLFSNDLPDQYNE